MSGGIVTIGLGLVDGAERAREALRKRVGV